MPLPFSLMERWSDLFPFVIGLLLVAGLVAAYLLDRRQKRRKAEAFQRLLQRDPSLRPTLEPCGLSPGLLAGTAATPRGDRRFGLEHGVSGPLEVEVDGRTVALDAAAFRWWYEDRRTSHSKHGSRTHYVTQTTVVAAVRIAHHEHIDIRITPESLFGRVGLTRGGQQVESSQFNRNFRVDTLDRTLAVHLLDARMQQRLLEGFTGRSVHLRGPLLVLGGEPSHRDASLPGVIGQLPAVRQDLSRLLEAIPPPFWRAVASDPQG